MEGLDLVIALGLVKGREDRLNPAEQTQADDASDHMRMRMPTAKGRFVIQLLHERQAQIRPCLQEMRAGRGTRLVGVLRQMHGMTIQINRVEVVDLFTAMHVARDDVGRVNRVHRPRHGPRIVGRVAACTDRMGLSCRAMMR